MPGDSVVEVSPPLISLSQSTYDELTRQINPLLDCADYGVQLFCKLFVFHRIQNLTLLKSDYIIMHNWQWKLN